MDLATFQWVAGIAISAMGGLVAWIARDFNEKIKDLREELKEATREREKLREILDDKITILHGRVNEQVNAGNAQSVTLAGFQGTFMTREEHARYCQQQHGNGRG